MSIRIELYAKDRFVDITDDLIACGGVFPDTLTEGIYPDDLVENNDGSLHYDLLGAINRNELLRKTFFDGRVHPMRIIDTDGGTFDVRLLLETRYSSRNA